MRGDSKLREYLLLQSEENAEFVNFKYAREGLANFRLYVVSPLVLIIEVIQYHK